MLVYGGIYVKRIELEHSLKLLDTRWNSLNLGKESPPSSHVGNEVNH